MNTERTSRGNNRGRVHILLAVVGLLSLIILSTSCRDETTVYDTYDFDELILYFQYTVDGRELFRTDGFVRDTEYTKPTDPNGVFRDLLDSTTRRFYVTTTPDSLVKDHGAPFGIVDDAEVSVQDVFYVRIQRVEGIDTTIKYQQRILNRHAYFLRLGGEDRAFRGWQLYAYNGGTPRQAYMEIKPANGEKFRGDGLEFQRFRYIETVEISWYGEDKLLDSVTTRTQPGYSQYSYMLLVDIGRVSKGDQLYMEGEPDTTNSMYQFISANTSGGPVYRLMDRTDNLLYQDTIQTPTTADRLYELIFFQEFQFVDRPGGVWCVPYRVQ